MLFGEHLFGRENSLSFQANSVRSAQNSVSSLLNTNNGLRGTHRALSLELGEGQKSSLSETVSGLFPTFFRPYQ